MRRGQVVASVSACLALAACGLPGAAGSGAPSASCAAPYVEVGPGQVQPGGPLTVRGEGHLDACHDTGEHGPAQPLDGLPVFFQQGRDLTDLGRLDARGPEGTVLATVTVPVDARPGPAEVTVGGSAPALVVVGDGGSPPASGPPTGPFELTIALQAVPVSGEGGWVVASASTVDVQVPDTDDHVTAAAPLGAVQVSLGVLSPTSWTVDVHVHRCERLDCPPPASAGAGPACPAGVRVLDRPTRLAYTHADGGCVLRAVG